MARSTLRYALPLAGLLFVAPAQAGQETTVRQFLAWSATEKVMYIGGVVDVLGSEMNLNCPKRQTLAEMLFRMQLAAETSPAWTSTPLLTAIGQVLKEFACTLGTPTTTAPTVEDAEDLS